jgi:hypothetical protein
LAPMRARMRGLGRPNNDTWPSGRPPGECKHERCPMLTMLTIAPLLPDTDDMGALDSGPLAMRRRPPGEAPPVQDQAHSLGCPHVGRHLALDSGHTPSVTRRPPPQEAHPQDHGLQPCSGWPAALRLVVVVQANWPCTWPRPCAVAAPKTFALGLGIVPQTQPAPQVFRVRASLRDDPRSPRATIHVTRLAAQREWR